jgi:hypothetical protein
MLLINKRLSEIATCLIAVALSVWSMPASAQMGPATWGNPNQPWGVRRPVTAADSMLVADYRSGHKQPVIETSFTSPGELQSQWALQSDDKWNLKSCRLPENIVTTNAGLQLQTLAATKAMQNGPPAR